jgi:hypothetical protein
MSGTQTKRNNSNLGIKLRLREHFLDRYHADKSPIIFDACCADSVLWNTLKKRYKFKYWGVDKRRLSSDILKIDSTRILSMDGWDFDIIDIDTWGSPFSQWFQILPRITKPITVFLTIGSTMHHGCATKEMMPAAGLGELTRYMPESFGLSLSPHLIDVALGRIYSHGLKAVECLQGKSGNMTYVGIRMEKN